MVTNLKELWKSIGGEVWKVCMKDTIKEAKGSIVEWRAASHCLWGLRTIATTLLINRRL